MFTGLVEALGEVRARHGSRLRMSGPRPFLADAVVGDSIAVDGCCLTIVDLGDDGGQGWWEADLSSETLARTTLADRVAGDKVNLERPVRLADRLGGHLVQGHVDGVGEVLEAAPALRVGLPEGLGRYVVEKGSITVDGVSLTVVAVDAASFAVAVIPHTAAVTTLGTKVPGNRVNLEVDLVAKYVERLLTTSATVPGGRP